MLTGTVGKKVEIDGAKKYAPCSPGDPEAREMAFLSIKDEELAVPLVEARDVVKALRESHPTSNKSSLEKYTEWANTKGADS